MKSFLQTVKLNDIAEINPGLPTNLPETEVVSFVPMSAVSGETGRIEAVEERTYNEVSKGYTPFINGDLLVAKITPCFENGKIAQAILPHQVGFGSTEFHVVRPATGKIDPRYLLHFLRQERIRREGELKMTGSAGQRRVPEHFLAHIETPLPSLDEQRRIAEVLDHAESLRAKRRTSLAALGSLGIAIFTEMFGDPIQQPKYSTTYLECVAEVVSGVTKGRKFNGQQPIEVPYLRVANVQAGFLDLAEIKTIQALPDEVEALRLLPGDVVLTEGGDFDKLGRGAIWEGQVGNCIHQNHVFRVRVDTKILHPQFFNHFLQTNAARSYFLRCAKRTTNLASINMTQLKALPVPLPPLSLQLEFAERITRIEKLKAAQRASLAELDALFASLQDRAFRGEL